MKVFIYIFLYLLPIISRAENQTYILQSGPISKTPIISDATFKRISAKNPLENKNFTINDKAVLDKKFKQVIETLQKEGIFQKIKSIAPKYDVSPEAVAACIIGEHVFNVTLTDSFQNYFISIYSKWLDKSNEVQNIYLQLLKEPEIQQILSTNETDYEKWSNVFETYNYKFRGRKNYPQKNFLFSFFNPVGIGLTYGLGQLSPIRVLLTNDIAVEKNHMKKINPEETNELYFATLDIDTNINYVSASVLASIINYQKYANFDISQNIGVIATLYNLGDEKRRAKELFQKNKLQQQSHQPIILPSENFYGWYMNIKEQEIKKLFSS